MALEYRKLDEQTRNLMLSELDSDVTNGQLYISRRLTDEGQRLYPELLREAITQYEDQWLATEMRRQNLFRTTEERKKPRGGYTIAKVPVTASDTLAEGEFNRFYCRAICLRAIESGQQNVVVYRAKQVEKPRPESDAKINMLVSAQTLLEDLRTHQGVEPALGLPPGPNSGLSVDLP